MANGSGIRDESPPGMSWRPGCGQCGFGDPCATDAVLQKFWRTGRRRDRKPMQ